MARNKAKEMGGECNFIDHTGHNAMGERPEK